MSAVLFHLFLEATPCLYPFTAVTVAALPLHLIFLLWFMPCKMIVECLSSACSCQNKIIQDLNMGRVDHGHLSFWNCGCITKSFQSLVRAKQVLYWGLARAIHSFLLKTLVVMVTAMDLQASGMERWCRKSRNYSSTNMNTLVITQHLDTLKLLEGVKNSGEKVVIQTFRWCYLQESLRELDLKMLTPWELGTAKSSRGGDFCDGDLGKN